MAKGECKRKRKYNFPRLDYAEPHPICKYSEKKGNGIFCRGE